MLALQNDVALSGECHEFFHLMEYVKSGTRDSVWVPQRASEGWILITADSARKAKGLGRENNLARLCRQHRITHVVLGPSIHRMKQFDKMRAILTVWDDLKKVAEASPGSRFMLVKGPKNPMLEKREYEQAQKNDRSEAEAPKD